DLAVKGSRPATRRSLIGDMAENHVVFIAGKTRNITKLNYIQLQHQITEAFGKIDRIYITGKDSLKLYCSNEAQKRKVKSTVTLGDVDIIATEPVVGYTQARNPRIVEVGVKGVIIGVTHDITEEEIREFTHATKVSRISRTENGRRVQTSAVLLTFDGADLPEDVRIGYRRFK